jgi:hypothetical protein
MDGSKANMARKLFEKEANQLVACVMPHEDVHNSLTENVAGLTVKSKVRLPILSEGEDEDPENHEMIFEETFQGEVPGAIVGLMFHDKTVRARDVSNNDVEVPLWEKVLM